MVVTWTQYTGVDMTWTQGDKCVMWRTYTTLGVTWTQYTSVGIPWTQGETFGCNMDTREEVWVWCGHIIQV